jgi:hypothetical protein
VPLARFAAAVAASSGASRPRGNSRRPPRSRRSALTIHLHRLSAMAEWKLVAKPCRLNQRSKPYSPPFPRRPAF